MHTNPGPLGSALNDHPAATVWQSGHSVRCKANKAAGYRVPDTSRNQYPRSSIAADHATQVPGPTDNTVAIPPQHDSVATVQQRSISCHCRANIISS